MAANLRTDLIYNSRNLMSRIDALFPRAKDILSTIVEI